MTDDMIGGALITICSIFTLLSVRKAYKDKAVKGVSLITVLYYVLFGLFYVYFFWNHNHLYSMFGQICLAIAETIWFCQMVYYTRIYPKLRGFAGPS